MNCEICNETDIRLDKHHINSKSKNGSNQIHNIALLCPNCHRRVHMGQIILEGRFQTSNGYKLLYHWKNCQDIVDRENPEVYTFSSGL